LHKKYLCLKRESINGIGKKAAENEEWLHVRGRSFEAGVTSVFNFWCILNPKAIGIK